MSNMPLAAGKLSGGSLKHYIFFTRTKKGGNNNEPTVAKRKPRAQSVCCLTDCRTQCALSFNPVSNLVGPPLSFPATSPLPPALLPSLTGATPGVANSTAGAWPGTQPPPQLLLPRLKKYQHSLKTSTLRVRKEHSPGLPNAGLELCHYCPLFGSTATPAPPALLCHCLTPVPQLRSAPIQYPSQRCPLGLPPTLHKDGSKQRAPSPLLRRVSRASGATQQCLSSSAGPACCCHAAPRAWLLCWGAASSGKDCTQQPWGQMNFYLDVSYKGKFY